MKKTFVLIFAFFFNQIHCQNLKVGIESGLGFYSMTDLKSVNEMVPQNLSFDTKLVSNFPPYLYYRLKFLLSNSNKATGLIYTFKSTGSRISGKDYSGEYKFDILVKSHVPGVYYEVNLNSPNKFNIYFYSTVGCIFSKLNFNEYLNISDSTLFDDNSDFQSFNYYVEPGLSFILPYDKISFGIFAGYMFQFGKQAFYFGKNKDNVLYINDRASPIKPDWNGFRIGISIYYNFFRKKTELSTACNIVYKTLVI